MSSDPHSTDTGTAAGDPDAAAGVGRPTSMVGRTRMTTRAFARGSDLVLGNAGAIMPAAAALAQGQGQYDIHILGGDNIQVGDINNHAGGAGTSTTSPVASASNLARVEERLARIEEKLDSLLLAQQANHTVLKAIIRIRQSARRVEESLTEASRPTSHPTDSTEQLDHVDTLRESLAHSSEGWNTMMENIQANQARLRSYDRLAEDGFVLPKEAKIFLPELKEAGNLFGLLSKIGTDFVRTGAHSSLLLDDTTNVDGNFISPRLLADRRAKGLSEDPDILASAQQAYTRDLVGTFAPAAGFPKSFSLDCKGAQSETDSTDNTFEVVLTVMASSHKSAVDTIIAIVQLMASTKEVTHISLEGPESEYQPNFPGNLRFLKIIATTLSRNNLRKVFTFHKFRFTGDQHADLKALKALTVRFRDCVFQDNTRIQDGVEQYSAEEMKKNAADANDQVVSPRPATTSVEDSQQQGVARVDGAQETPEAQADSRVTKPWSPGFGKPGEGQAKCSGCNANYEIGKGCATCSPKQAGSLPLGLSTPGHARTGGGFSFGATSTEQASVGAAMSSSGCGFSFGATRTEQTSVGADTISSVAGFSLGATRTDQRPTRADNSSTGRGSAFGVATVQESTDAESHVEHTEEDLQAAAADDHVENTRPPLPIRRSLRQRGDRPEFAMKEDPGKAARKQPPARG